MVCFNHCLLPAVTSGSSSCLSSASGMTSKEKASPLLSTAVLFGSVVESLTTDGLWEKHSNNWTLCDHESFEELWHLNVFFSNLHANYFLFQYLHWNWFWSCALLTLKKIIDIVCLAYVIWKSKHKLWKCQCFCCFKHVC